MPRTSPFNIVLSDNDRLFLEELSRKYTAPYFEVVRARIILYAAFGLSNDQIAARLDTPRRIVSKWRKRFFFQGMAGLANLPRRGSDTSNNVEDEDSF